MSNLQIFLGQPVPILRLCVWATLSCVSVCHNNIVGQPTPQLHGLKQQSLIVSCNMVMVVLLIWACLSPAHSHICSQLWARGWCNEAGQVLQCLGASQREDWALLPMVPYPSSSYSWHFLSLARSCSPGSHVAAKEEVGMLRIGSVTDSENLGRSLNLSLNILMCKMETILPIVRDDVGN